MDEARSLTYSINVEANTAQAESDIRSLTSGLGNLQNGKNTLIIGADTGPAESGIRDVVSSLGDTGREANRQATSIGSAFRGAFLDSIDSGDSFASSLKSGVGGAFSFVGNKAGELKDSIVETAQNIGHGFRHPIETIKTGLGNAVQGAKDKFIDMARGAEEASDETDELGDSSRGAKPDVEGLGNAAESSGSKFEGLGSIIKNVAAGIGIAIGVATTAVTGFAASSLGVGMEFDSSMSQVAATMGYTVEELNTVGSEANQTFSELRDFAMDMGASTAFSASQAADALNYMALAGYDADTSMAMLPNVLNLAAAGGIELADASDMVTDAQSALGLSIDETTELVDRMAMASSKSNTSVAQLGEAILSIGGTAKNLAGGTTELNTALGILADNGIKGAEGGTHLRNVILSLGSPSDTAAKALSQLGVSVFDAEGKMRPLNETFGDLNSALSSMSQGDKLAAIGDIFNTTDIAAVNALLDTSAERWDELGGSISNATGAAENMAATQLDNLSGDITMFKSALEGAQIIISDQLSPDLRQFVQFGTEGISTLSTAFQGGGLSGAMSAFGDILSEGLSMIMGMLPSMVDAGMQLLSSLGQGLLDNLPLITGAAVDIILMLARGILEALPQLVGAAAEIIATLASGIGEALPELIPMAVNALLLVVETLIDNLPLILDAGMQRLQGLAQGIMDSIPLLLEQLPELINQFVNFLTENLPTIIEQGLQLIESLAMGIVEGIPILVNQLPGLISSVSDFFTANMPSILEQGVQVVVNIANGILQAIPQLLAALPEIITGTVNFITANLPIIIEQGINLVVQLAQGILQAIPQLVAALPSIISAVVNGLAQLPGMVLNIGVNIVQGLWNGISSMAGWLWGQISGWASNLMSNIKGFFGIHSPSTVFAELGKFMGLGVGIGFTSTMDKVSTDMEKAIPTSFDMPALNAPEAVPALPSVATAVQDNPDLPTNTEPIVYIVAPLVEGVNIPPISDMMYNVKPVVEDFNPPDVSGRAMYETDSEDEWDDDDSESPPVTVRVPGPDVEPEPRDFDPTGGPAGPAAPFAPVINIYVQSGVDDETIARLRAELHDEMKSQYEEFRKQELEEMSLKVQYKF